MKDLSSRTSSRTKFFAAVAVVAVAWGVGSPSDALADNFQFDVSGGGDWNTASNWFNFTQSAPAATPPTIDDIAITDSRMGATPATISFSADGVARNLSIQGTGPSSLTLDLDGRTLTLSTATTSTFGGNTTITGGTVNHQTQGYEVNNGATLTIATGGVVEGRGGINLMNVTGNSTLAIDGGSLQHNDGAKRDLAVASGSTVAFTGAGGSIGRGGTGAIRRVQMQNDSTLSFTLNNSGYYDLAPILAGGVPNLGNLHLAFANDYVHNIGEEFFLVDYGFEGVTDSFGNAPLTGDTVTFQGYAFAVNYAAEGGTISVTAIPEPASLALLGLGGLMMLGRRRSQA